MSDVQSLDALIEALRKLPGVGIKSAQRMAFHLLQRDQAGALQLARALDAAVNSVHHCERCHTFTEGAICSICADAGAMARGCAWWRRLPIWRPWSAQALTRAITTC